MAAPRLWPWPLSRSCWFRWPVVLRPLKAWPSKVTKARCSSKAKPGHAHDGSWSLAEEVAPWWERTTLDLDRNGVHDALDGAIGPVWIGLSYGTTVDEGHVAAVEALGLPVELVVPAVDALLLGQVDASMIPTLRALDDVVMVEAYGELVFWGDVQTPAVKASSSSVYPEGAWDLGVSGEGIVIAMVDTGVDNEHLD